VFLLNEFIIEQDVKDFFLTTYSRLESYYEFLNLHASELAPRFSSFNFIQPDENSISDIIAHLLDPGENHDQGSIFLMEFLDIIKKEIVNNGLSSIEPEHITIKREEATRSIDRKKRRIDIVMKLSNNDNQLVIGIENKPWAKEQDDQVSDYIKYLEKEYGKFVLIYLSSHGEMPNSIEEKEREKRISEGQLAILSFNKLEQWLEKCRMRSKSDRVRTFLRDFEIYIHQKFEGSTIMEKEIIIKQATDNSKNLKVALMVAKNIVDIKEKLFSKLMGDIREQLKEDKSDLKLDVNFTYWNKYSDFEFYKESWENYSIAFEAESTEMKEIIFGISRKQEDPDPKIYEVNTYFGNGDGGNDHWWLWHKYLDNPYRNWGNELQPWVDMLTPQMKDYIIKKVYDLCNKLEKFASEQNIKL